MCTTFARQRVLNSPRMTGAEVGVYAVRDRLHARRQSRAFDIHIGRAQSKQGNVGTDPGRAAGRDRCGNRRSCGAGSASPSPTKPRSLPMNALSPPALRPFSLRWQFDHLPHPGFSGKTGFPLSTRQRRILHNCLNITRNTDLCCHFCQMLPTTTTKPRSLPTNAPSPPALQPSLPRSSPLFFLFFIYYSRA